MYKELFDTGDIIEKTVEGVTYALSSDQMIIAFVDETFITFGVAHGYEENEIYVYQAKLNFESFSRDLIRSGVISPEEFKQKMDEIWKTRREAEFRRYKVLEAEFERNKIMASAQVDAGLEPELLEALETLYHLISEVANPGAFDNGVYAPDGRCEGDILAGEIIEQARIAIAKAKGEGK